MNPRMSAFVNFGHQMHTHYYPLSNLPSQTDCMGNQAPLSPGSWIEVHSYSGSGVMLRLSR